MNSNSPPAKAGHRAYQLRAACRRFRAIRRAQAGRYTAGLVVSQSASMENSGRVLQ